MFLRSRRRLPAFFGAPFRLRGNVGSSIRALWVAKTLGRETASQFEQLPLALEFPTWKGLIAEPMTLPLRLQWRCRRCFMKATEGLNGDLNSGTVSKFALPWCAAQFEIGRYDSRKYYRVPDRARRIVELERCCQYRINLTHYTGRHRRAQDSPLTIVSRIRDKVALRSLPVQAAIGASHHGRSTMNGGTRPAHADFIRRNLMA